MDEYYLRTHPDPCLMQVCLKVNDFSGLDGLLSAMLMIASSPSVAGLAAPQVGDNRRVIIAKVNGIRHVLVNPEIIYESGSVQVSERCLSRPYGLSIGTRRKQTIKVSYKGIRGNNVTEVYTGWNAVILQHEIDHLNGKLIGRF